MPTERSRLTKLAGGGFLMSAGDDDNPIIWAARARELHSTIMLANNR